MELESVMRRRAPQMLVTALLWLAGCASPRAGFLLVDRGNAHREAGRIEEAIVEYERALEGYGDDPSVARSARSALSVAHGERGDRETALRWASELVEHAPEDPHGWWRKARLEEDLERASEALATWDAGVWRHPDDAALRQGRGKFHMSGGRYAQAIRDYSRAIELKPEDARSQTFLGWCHLYRGDPEAAVRDLTASMARRDEPRATDYVGRARAYAMRHDEPAALADFKRALELRPGDAETLAWRSLARTLWLDGDPQEALEDAAAALQADPETPLAWCARSRAKHALGDLDGALADLTELLKTRPRSWRARAVRARLRLEADDLDGAFEDADLAVEGAPHKPLVWRTRALVHAAAERRDEALADLERALDISPSCPEARLLRAELHLQAERLVAARVDVDAARLDLPRDRRRAHGLRAEIEQRVAREIARSLEAARAHQADADWATALEHYDAVLTLDPGRLAARYGKALCLDELNEKRQASREISQLIEALGGGDAVPDDPENHALLCGALQRRALLSEFWEQNYAEAYRDYERLFVLAPKVDTLERRARCALLSDQPAAAIRIAGELLRAIAEGHAEDNPATALNIRGAAQWRQRKLDAALTDFNEAIRRDASLRFPWMNRALLLESRGDLDGALSRFREAAARFPDLRPAADGVARVERRLREKREAERREENRRDRLEYLEGQIRARTKTARASRPRLLKAKREADRRLKRQPRHWSGYAMRAEYYLEAGEYARARRDFDTAIQRHANEFALYNDRGLARLFSRDFRGALRDFGQAIRLNPRSAVVYRNRAWAYSLLLQDERALADLDAAIRLDSLDAHTFVRRGVLHRDRERYDAAIRDFDAAIRLMPGLDSAYFHRGVTHIRTGDTAPAARDFEASLRFDEDAATHFNLALCRRILGDPESAQRHLRRALELAPDHAGARDMLRELESGGGPAPRPERR